jgi:toxin ParE1/3/4
MRIRWTSNAAEDLTRIVEHIRKDRPSAAQRVAKTIYEGVASLRNMPQRVRIGRAGNTCELVFARLPYIAVYEITPDQVQVLRIRHTSPDRP